MGSFGFRDSLEQNLQRIKPVFSKYHSLYFSAYFKAIHNQSSIKFIFTVFFVDFYLI